MRFAAWLMLVVACRASPSSSRADVVLVPAVEATPGPPVDQPDVVPTRPPAERYRVVRGDYRAELRIWPTGEGRIRFSIEVEVDCPGGRCAAGLKGDGRKHPQAHLGAESRELDGEAVLVNQYYYDKKDCRLSVLVDADRKHAWVEGAGCHPEAEPRPYGTGVLTRYEDASAP